MMYGKNKEKCIRTKYQFFQNTPTPVVSQKLIDDAAIESIVKINNNAIMMKITTALNEQFPLVKGEEKNHRYIFDDIIELTVTDKEQGFVGFRHLKNGKCYYNAGVRHIRCPFPYRSCVSHQTHLQRSPQTHPASPYQELAGNRSLRFPH